MRYQFVLAPMLALLWQPQAHASVSEIEPNSTVRGSAPCTYQADGSCIPDGTALVRDIVEYDLNGIFDASANLDPRLANPLSTSDETIGRISEPRDYDWYYLDINSASLPETPVYFECDLRHGTIIFESLKEVSDIDPDLVAWDIRYFYDNDPTDAIPPVYRGSSRVLPNECKRGGTTTAKGPYRFQMNTKAPGRYYVRIWADLIANNQVFEDKIDINGDGTDETRRTFYDVIYAQTAYYTLSAFTSHRAGEIEPNDGRVEAYGLVSGTTVTDQLASMYDQDWFYVDNDITQNTSGKISFYFKCSSEDNNKLYRLSAFNDQSSAALNSYDVPSSQCSSAGGFLFTVNAPVSARYYFEVAAATFTEPDQFSQSNYTVLAIANNSGVSGTTARLPGELEPNETPVNAYPLADTVPITAQLSSSTDLDYYYYDNDASKNPSGTVPINFRCPSKAGNYTLSYFNTQGFLQQAYNVSADQCSQVDPADATKVVGFQFNISTPATARYYILVSSQPDGTFSSDDYILSAFVNLAAEAKADTSGVLKKVSIVNGGKDSFAISLKQCGTKKGSIRLTGHKLNLAKQSKNTQVKVEIGGWSCVSDTKELGVTTDAAGATVYSYPKLATPTKEPKRTQLSVTQ